MSISNLLKAKSEFRKRGVTLIADKTKSGGGGTWKFASEDNLIKQIQEPLTSVGLEYVATLRAMPELNINMVVGTLYHVESGEHIESSKILETPEPRKDKNGNSMYLDAEIEAGKQFGYWSRVLAIRLLGLSDLDPEDVQNVPVDISEITGAQVAELHKLIENADGIDMEAFLKFAQADKIENIKTDVYPKVRAALLKKQKDAA